VRSEPVLGFVVIVCAGGSIGWNRVGTVAATTGSNEFAVRLCRAIGRGKQLDIGRRSVGRACNEITKVDVRVRVPHCRDRA
jgi:hypothetical protein